MCKVLGLKINVKTCGVSYIWTFWLMLKVSMQDIEI